MIPAYKGFEGRQRVFPAQRGLAAAASRPEETTQADRFPSRAEAMSPRVIPLTDHNE